MLVFFRRYRMQFDLRNHRFDELTPPPNFQLLEWQPRLLTAHSVAKFRSFRNELDANVFPCLGNPDGCQKLMNEITGRKEFLPEATWLLAHADPEREAVINCGTVQGVMDGPNVGMIQNIGIVKSYRGLGLGSLIIRKSLAGFQKAGAKVVALEVTAHNIGAIGLYERLGFKTEKVVYKTVEVPNP